MIRLKQLLPGVILWAVLLLAMLLLTFVFVDPSLSHSERGDLIEDGQVSILLGGIVPCVVFAVTWMALAVWAAFGSGSHTRRVVNCLLAAMVVGALVEIQKSRWGVSETVLFFFLSIGTWLVITWALVSLRIAGSRWRIESFPLQTSVKPSIGWELIGWLLTLVSAVLVWRIMSGILPGAIGQQCVEIFQEWTTQVLLLISFHLLMVPLIFQLWGRLPGWINNRWIRLVLQTGLIGCLFLGLPSVALMLGVDLRSQGDHVAVVLSAILMFMVLVTFFATLISLERIGDWFLARKKRWPLLVLLTLLAFWAMIPGLLLRICGYRFVGRRSETDEPVGEDGRCKSTWITGLTSFAMLTLLLVTSVYAGFRSTGMMRQHELALIGFNEETGDCFVGVIDRPYSFGDVPALHPHLFLTDGDFEVLQHCSNLRELLINGNPYVTGSFLALLHGQTELTRLQLIGCRGLLFKNLQHASHFTQLKEFNLSRLSLEGMENESERHRSLAITAKDLSFIRSLKQLETVLLYHCELSGERVLEPLGELPQLKRVGLDYSSVTDQQLAPLAKAELLSFLGLIETRVGDVGLAHLEGLKKLKVLFLNATRVTDRGLASLANHHELVGLFLVSTAITDRGLVHLGELQQLQTLNLENTKVTGAGLVHLAGLKQLWRLDLGGTQINDADLVHLKSLEKMWSLNLPEFSDVFTPAGLCRLVIHFPKYENYISSSDGSPLAGKDLTAHSAAVFLNENVPADELSADERLQMASRLLAGEYGVKLKYDGQAVTYGEWESRAPASGDPVGVTFDGSSLSDEHLLWLSWLPQLSSVELNYSAEEEAEKRQDALNESPFQPSTINELAQLPGLKKLQLGGTFFSDDVIQHVIQLKGLSSLELSTPRLTGATLAQLEQLTGLQEISFSSCQELTDEGLLAIAAIPRIRSVSLVDCKKTSSKGLVGILSLPQLERLTLDEAAKNLGEQALQKLATSRLKSVTLVGELDDSICARLAAIASLEEVTLSSTVFRAEQLGRLQGLEGLVSLKLAGCTSLTTEGLRQLNQLTGLRRLHLNHTEVSDEALLQLTDLAQLEFLDLRVNESLTDAGLAALAAMPRLQELSLFYCPGIQGAGLAHLAKLSDLKVLDIGNTKIQDVGLERLSENRSIRELNLSLSLNFTDAGAIHLARMKQLKKLELGFTTQLSLDLILKLDAELPGCKITPSQR